MSGDYGPDDVLDTRSDVVACEKTVGQMGMESRASFWGWRVEVFKYSSFKMGYTSSEFPFFGSNFY